MIDAARSARLLFLMLLTAATGSCSGKPTQPGSTAENDTAKIEKTRSGTLLRDEAAIRAKQIQKVAYQLAFLLDEKADTFKGKATLRFVFRSKGLKKNQDLWVDLVAKNIHSATINSKPVTDLTAKRRYNGERLWLKDSELVQGQNELAVEYEAEYGKAGHGLVKNTDRQDGNTYLYTNLEPFHAHQVFPCFDQPDLKGTYQITVDAPESWTVISTQRETKLGINDEGHKRWTFPTTPPISPYTFALHAGPFSVWKAFAEKTPLRLFARKSVAGNVDQAEWFDVTRRGIEFYQTHFGNDYPLSKYDQVIVPNLTVDGVEGAGAALFTERFVFQDRTTEDRKRERSIAILRELSHAWFGNLVTIRWWNGLWLKESFATFMATWALEQNTPVKGAWHSFFAAAKTTAYDEDLRATAHVVDISVPDTDAAYKSYDPTGYGKGAALIKQLVRTIGEDNFKEGIQRYFDKYSGRSATLADLMRTLGEAAGEDLTDWQGYWFQTVGVNTLETQIECSPDDDEVAAAAEYNQPIDPDAQLYIKKLVLKQSGPSQKNLMRPHRTQIALYDLNPKSPRAPLKPTEVLDVEYFGAETEVTEARGNPCPDLVFANHGDFDYVRLKFDPKSFETLKQHVSRLEDPISRHLYWRTLWLSVEDGTLPAREFAELVLKEAPREKNTLILADLLSLLISDDVHASTAIKFLPDSERTQLMGRVESALKLGTLNSPRGSDQRATWLAAYFRSVHSEAGQDFLRSLVRKGRKNVALTLNQSQRWNAIEALARTGSVDAAKIIADELSSDGSDQGRVRAIAAEAAIPDEASKRKWLDRISQARTDRFTSGQLRAAMRTLLTGGDELISKLGSSYFETLPQIAANTDEDYADGFARDLFPSVCREETIRDATRLLDKNPHLPPSLTRRIRDLREGEERCVRARNA